MEYLVSTDNLSKQYKGQKAVNKINLHVERGSVYGFIGRNGAGKTTTLKMLSGLIGVSEGKITMFGYSGNELKRHNIFSKIGVLIEAPGLYPNMTAFENLSLKCLCLGIKNRKEYINNLLKMVGIDYVGKKKVKNYSLGMKQRLGIAMALIGEPEMLLLDEPINGLDPQGIAEVRTLLHKLNTEQNITIIISSHVLMELEKVATNYGIINDGELIREITSEALIEICKEKNISLEEFYFSLTGVHGQ